MKLPFSKDVKLPFLQDALHRFEQGGGMRYFRIALAVLGVLLLIVGYNLRAFRNMSTQEAMDSAQLARNIARGKGYTTLFIRPFSMFLVKKHNLETQGPPPAGKPADLAEIRTMHPDLANPPVYPVVLAGLMKVLPFHYAVITSKPFWSTGGSFLRYEPDFLIALFNQLLFVALTVLVFLLARRLFDPGVAWLSAALLLGTELLWQFSVSGLSTLLLMVIFLGLAWCLVLLEAEVRTPKWGPNGVLVLAALAGAMAGVGGLTRYAFGLLIIPLLVSVAMFGGQRRVVLALTAFAAFAVVMTPWVVRNYSVCGQPFGTATFAALEETGYFPAARLERSLNPELNQIYPRPFWFKFNINLHEILSNELPKLGGNWISAFFLVGLLLPFRSPAITRLRYFLVGCLLVLTLAQAMGRTQLSEKSPEINSENLLVVLAPLVLVYGVSLFYLLLDQMILPFPEFRFVVIGGFSLVACLPMVFVFLPPRVSPVAYPPYHPLAIQTVAGWLKEDELAMSDIPWAVAWYGQRQCMWLTLQCMRDTRDPNATREDFIAINDYQKPINALYLTRESTDARFFTDWINAGERSWGNFIMDTFVRKQVPDYFPLSQMPVGWMPEQLVLTDWQRWKKP